MMGNYTILDRKDEKLICKMAIYYILHPKCSQTSVAKYFATTQQKVSEYFKHYLPSISPYLSKRVTIQKIKNMKGNWKRFEKKYTGKH